ncbi:nicotinamide-nucleotide adenylyltransferase [Candidatus Thorarchaeota archaeon]|jgi:nicotinamide-nucleotide adenylyltransferase|nr:MAG: nicotinamide-nucleotide adenylyltransferase [Candidatus Thorarchaeota archaeon]
MKSLFIGRFQPIHKGHVHTIKQILNKGEDIIVVVGSAQYSHTPDNPFSGGERVMFIRRALLDEKISLDRVCTVPLSDVHIHPLWVSHLRSFVPYFDKAYSHNPLVKRLLEDSGIETDSTKLLERSTYSGRHIRDLIRWGNNEWEALVPKGVVKLIKKHKMDDRIKEIADIRLKR